jgi:integrase/recombinase XerD
MANRTATLIRYAKLPNVGWRRGTLVKAKNGQFKPGFMIYNGQEFEASQGVYQSRTYNGKTAIHVSVGNDLAAAQVMLKKHIAVREKAENEAILGIPPEPKPEERTTLADLASAYIADKLSPSQGLSRTSTRLYENTLKSFVAYAKRQYVTDVIKQDITGFIDLLMEQGYAQKSRVMRYTVVRGFLQNSGIDLKTLIDPATHKRLKVKPEAVTEPYTQTQLEKLFAVCTPYYRMVFTVLLHTGMRFREANHLTWANVKWGENKIFVPGEQRITHKGKTVTFQSKSRKSRKIPMYGSLKAALMEWREQNPNAIYVVGSPRGDQPNNHWLEYGNQFWNDAELNCGVCDGCNERGECEQFYLHKFRHTYAHRCLDRKIDIYEVQGYIPLPEGQRWRLPASQLHPEPLWPTGQHPRSN